MRAGKLGYPAAAGSPGCRRHRCRRCARRAGRRRGRPRRGRRCPTRRSRRSAGRRRSRLVITVAAFAPALPQGTRSALSRAATSLTSWDALVRLTTRRRRRSAPGPEGKISADTPSEGRPESPSGPVAPRCPRWRGWTGPCLGLAGLLRLRLARRLRRHCAGRGLAGVAGIASASAAGARVQRATWTAQSVRPGSPNSRVPSRGSTIQTRSAVRRALSSMPSSERTASSGLAFASSAIRNSWEERSPAFLSTSGSPPWARRSSSRRPARSARSCASAWSSASVKLPSSGFDRMVDRCAHAGVHNGPPSSVLVTITRADRCGRGSGLRSGPW